MPKLNDFQNSTVRLLDYLYFHDVVAMQGFSEEKSSIYSQLLAAIDLLAYRRSEGALIREHYKHLLLIGVDFELTFGKGELIKDDIYFKMQEKYRAYLIQQIELLGFQIEHYKQDLDEVLIQIPIQSITSAAAFKIVSQVLYFEYDNITIGVLSKFLDFNFLTLAKYQKKNKVINESFLNKLFYRAMLFLEFDIFKNNLIAEYYSEDQIVNLNDLEDYEKVAAAIKARGKAKSLKGIEYDGFYKLKTKNDLKKFLINIEERLGHNPIFSDSSANWIALIGAWHLILKKGNNLDKPLFKESPQYIVDSDISCAKLARKKLADFGFSVSEKTIFDCYDRVYDIYTLIRITVECLVEEKMYGMNERVFIHDFYYNPNSNAFFKKQLQAAKAKL
ncbi:hypothetical protein ACG9XX_12720 [Acinetobacter baumannii]|uniref:hypothetical protein n=1 Tax=Acinetobacter TaxID=469 RepID=UPI0002485570|nr:MULTISPECIES: hypothetical protein [Acinetobacter]MCO8070274.1 hypothetical protein [Acinetobacter lwoffii]